MENTGTSDSGFDGSYRLFAQESTDDNFFSGTEDDLRVSVSVPRPELKHYKLTSVCLGLLGVLLLLVDVSLSIYYSKVRDRYLRLNDVSYIRNELLQLQDAYMIAMQSRDEAKTMLARQNNERYILNLELEHQKRRSRDYNAQIQKIQGANAAIRANLPLIEDGCKHCLPGWMLLNTMCYFLPLSDSVSRRSWQDARTQCRKQGADLTILDSREKQLSVFKIITDNQVPGRNIYHSGFWIGLKDDEEEGHWKWRDGKSLVEGYWNEGEPNDDRGGEDCAAVYPRDNPFHSWNDAPCGYSLHWICEMPPRSRS